MFPRFAIFLNWFFQDTRDAFGIYVFFTIKTAFMSRPCTLLTAPLPPLGGAFKILTRVASAFLLLAMSFQISSAQCGVTFHCPGYGNNEKDLGNFFIENVDTPMLACFALTEIDTPTTIHGYHGYSIDDKRGRYGIKLHGEACGSIRVRSCDEFVGEYDCCSGYTMRRTVMMYDDLNNNGVVDPGEQSSSCVYSYSINADDRPPELSVPDDVTLECGDAIPKAKWTVSDGCRVSVVVTEERTDFNSCEYVIDRTYTATDACGHVTAKTQQITIEDNDAPVVKLTNPELASVKNGGYMDMYGCDRSPALLVEDAVFSDCCTAGLVVEAYDKLVATNVCDIFGYYRKWECGYYVTDGAGNETHFRFFVRQHDTISPVLHNVPESMELGCDDTIPTAPVVTATDDCHLDGDVEMSTDTLGSPADSAYAIIRTWSASDLCGSMTTASQLITVCGFDTTGVRSRLGSLVFMDNNANGVQDIDELGYNGVQVFLYRMEDGIPELVDEAASVTANGLAGHYGFDYLEKGEYMLRFAIADNLKFTLQDVGDDDSIDSDVSPDDGTITGIFVESGQSLMHLNAGVTRSGKETATIVGLQDVSDPLDQRTMIGQNELRTSESSDLGGAISSNRIAQGATLFPNPTSDRVTIVLGNELELNYRVVNQLGQVVMEGTFEAGATKSLDLSAYANGLYFVSLQSSDGLQDFRVIKQ